MKKIFLILLLIFIAGCGKTYPVRINWTPPTTGAPVDHYLVEIKRGSEYQTFESFTTSFEAKFNYDTPCWVRVAAVGTTDLIGPYSEKSETLFLPTP